MPYPRKTAVMELSGVADSISMLLCVSRLYLTEKEQQAFVARLRPYFDGIADLLAESAVEHRDLIESYRGEELRNGEPTGRLDPGDRIDEIVEVEMAALAKNLLP